MIGSRQLWRHLRGRENFDSSPPDGRTEPLDWTNFLSVVTLDDSYQFILGHDFVRKFDVTFEFIDGLIRTRNSEKKFTKRPVKKLKSLKLKDSVTCSQSNAAQNVYSSREIIPAIMAKETTAVVNHLFLRKKFPLHFHTLRN